MDLNPVGRSQAEEVGRRLAAFVADPAVLDYVSSPMRRTRDTMALMRDAAGLEPDAYRCDPRLAELAFGAWEGLTWKELRRRDPARYGERERDRWRFVPPGGGESYADLALRVVPAIRELTRDTVVVAHGGVARAMMREFGGASERDALHASIWQGRILLFRDGRCDWIEPDEAAAPSVTAASLPPGRAASAGLRRSA